MKIYKWDWTYKIRRVKDMARFQKQAGDLGKRTNILVTDSGPVITDLDVMRVHRWGLMFKIKRDKDITRLTKDEQTNRCKDEDKS